jgi:hypothetical protein
VHTLDLSYCSITDLSAIRNVRSLKFQGFRGCDVSGLVNVVILDISMSRLISDITMLQRLETLNIVNCPKITDLTNLDRLKGLSCDFGMEVADEKSLQNRTVFRKLKKLTTIFPIQRVFTRTRSFQENWMVFQLPDLLHLELFHCIISPKILWCKFSEVANVGINWL